MLSSANFTSGKVLNTPRGGGEVWFVCYSISKSIQVVCLFVFWTVFTFFNMIFWFLREVDQRGDIISLRNTLNLPISLLQLILGKSYVFFTFFAEWVYGHDSTNVWAGGYLVLPLAGLASPPPPTPHPLWVFQTPSLNTNTKS